MRILVVDDNKENLYLLEVLLKESGYEVVTAGNGAEALEKLHTESVDFIVSDILMPVMDGFQLCRKVKENDELKNIPFIFYTATYTDRKDEELALKLGSYKFIRKPAEPDEFIKIIQGMTRDVEKGKVVPKKPTIEEEEAFKLYSERLVNKLEKKMLDLEREVTERKRMEEELRESEAKYSALVEQAKDIVVIVQDGVCKFANRAVKKFSGFAVEEVVGKPFMNWIAPESRDIVAQRYKLRISGEKVPLLYEAKVQCKDGAIKDIEVSAGVIQYQGRPTEIAVARDVTERKKMENELRQSEEKFRRIAKNIEDVLYSVDGETQEFRYVSPAFERLLGYTLEDIRQMGGRRAFLSLVVQEGKFAEQQRNFERLKLQRGMRDMPDRYETWWRCKDGSLKCLEDRWIPVYDGERLVGTDGVLRDITERKKMEEELRRHTEHLEELVEERTREVKELNESIIQRLTQKISQIDNVATIRDKLRRTPDISTGLDLILDTALTDLGMDVGAVLLIDHKENAARLRGFKSRIEGVKVEESYSLDKGFAEFEAYKDKKNLSKVVRQSELSALGTASIHCAPILLGREVYGVLAFGSQKALTLDESDLAVLSLYAELTSILFEAQSLVVAPVKEVAEGAKRKFELESGSSYLVKNDVEKAFEVFTDNVLGGFEGLCITRQFPLKVRRKYGLEKTPIIWLTNERAEGETTVHSIQDLSILIANFLDKAKRCVVLLDGLEYLITNHGFEISIRFLQTARSRFEQKDAILVAPLLEKAIDAKEVMLIEREMKPLIAQ